MLQTKFVFASYIALAASLNIAPAAAQSEPFEVTGTDGVQLNAEPLGAFDSPWAMTFLPDGKMVVSEKTGSLIILEADGKRIGKITGVPKTKVSGQGGFGDVILHPDFENNSFVYISYVEWDGKKSGAVVDQAELRFTALGGALINKKRIWTQTPKADTSRHYSHRLVFGPEGHLYITSGDRGKQKPAQDMSGALGKIIRLKDDGSIPEDNPFATQGGLQGQFWSIGHRNMLGADFDANGQLWAHEMGPRHGDELNKIQKGANYGWPVVSDGKNYSGLNIPDHETSDLYEKPAISWVPSIAPSSLVIYDGAEFEDWKGNAFIGGLRSTAIIRVSLEGDKGVEKARYSWDMRVREIEQGPDGALYVLEDGPDGRLLRITQK